MNNLLKRLRLASSSEFSSENSQEKQSYSSDTTKDIAMESTFYGHTTSHQNSVVSVEQYQNQLVVKAALGKLFNDNHFSICKLDSIMEIVGASKHTTAYKRLSALHCVHFSDMDKELRDMLPSMVNEALKGQQKQLEVVNVAMDGLFN